MKIVSLKYDYSFKQLMRNEEVLKYFVSDVLGIPVREIRSVRLVNPFLWKRYAQQKEGILDIKAELNNDSRVNIELQIRMLAYWDKRSLFYLAKMFTEDLLVGEKYHKLKKCICINVLDFNLDNGPEYHRVYRLRDEKGQEFSDMFEVHVIELRKQLSGGNPVDDWIRLLNAKTEAELDMIRTKNPGILEAIRETKVMSLRKDLRALYEAHMKEIRDRNARDDYVWELGRAEGMETGKAEGIEAGRAEGIETGRAEGIETGRVEGIEAGRAEGMAQAVLQLLSEKGEVPEELAQIILRQKNKDIINRWLMAAARVENIDMFAENLEITAQVKRE